MSRKIAEKLASLALVTMREVGVHEDEIGRAFVVAATSLASKHPDPDAWLRKIATAPEAKGSTK